MQDAPEDLTRRLDVLDAELANLSSVSKQCRHELRKQMRLAGAAPTWKDISTASITILLFALGIWKAVELVAVLLRGLYE
jgi:hypothetical protein